ncbi:hypothetical protein DL95DRAFT_457850 [Leptodontidium sp. 2 PMI_412]|nr:hypothetical protein DL95DRAFT_457850 [Leptodontidium sp. 2 PMI_412]
MLLSPPEKVQRKDGTPVKLVPRISDKEELKVLGQLMPTKPVLLVAPLFLYAIWSLPYIGSYLSLYFSVRSRALASLVSALAYITTNALFGSFVDWQCLSLNTRARWGFLIMTALTGASWIWGAVIQPGYTKHKPALDWFDPGFARGWTIYILWQVNLAKFIAPPKRDPECCSIVSGEAPITSSIALAAAIKIQAPDFFKALLEKGVRYLYRYGPEDVSNSTVGTSVLGACGQHVLASDDELTKRSKIEKEVRRHSNNLSGMRIEG